MENKRTAVKSISIHILSVYPSYVDFEIAINGVPDGSLYRQYKAESKFRKVLGMESSWGKAVRGKARAAVQQLLDDMLHAGCLLAVRRI